MGARAERSKSSPFLASVQGRQPCGSLKELLLIKNTSVKDQSIWSWQSKLQQSMEVTVVEKVLNKIKKLIINYTWKVWCWKSSPYCLHSHEPELAAFPVGSLSWKGKDSINIGTELTLNISEMVTKHKGTLKELSRGHECFHCPCGVSSLNKGIQSPSLPLASSVNFGERLNKMFINLKWKKAWKWTLCLLTHLGTLAPVFFGSNFFHSVPACNFWPFHSFFSGQPHHTFLSHLLEQFSGCPSTKLQLKSINRNKDRHALKP